MFNDLDIYNQNKKKKIVKSINKAIDENNFIFGKNVKKFEKLPYYEPNVIFAVDFNEDNPHIHKESKIPGLIFELDSNVESTWQGVKIRTNSMGVRDREYDKKKPENTYRIIGLGDSVTFGANIDENETFLNILEEK